MVRLTLLIVWLLVVVVLWRWMNARNKATLEYRIWVLHYSLFDAERECFPAYNALPSFGAMWLNPIKWPLSRLNARYGGT